jgi:hypothetical protein
MESLSGSDRDYALRQVAFVSAARKEGYTEDEVAGKAGYRGSGHMRQELELWGFPTWFIEGDAPPKPKAEQAGQPTPLARGTGPIKELPPASNAMPLFREKLEALAQANEDLRYRKEKWQGGRFHQSSLNTRSKIWGLGGGTPAPQAPLPALIATYVLLDGEIDPLLDALYPGTPPADVVEKIRKRIEDKKSAVTEDGLKALARQLASLVRGGEVGKGRDRVEVPADDDNLACRITDGRDAGMSDQDIFDNLRNNPMLKEELTWKKYRRLRDLELRWPFQE